MQLPVCRQRCYVPSLAHHICLLWRPGSGTQRSTPTSAPEVQSLFTTFKGAFSVDFTGTCLCVEVPEKSLSYKCSSRCRQSHSVTHTPLITSACTAVDHSCIDKESFCPPAQHVKALPTLAPWRLSKAGSIAMQWRADKS